MPNIKSAEKRVKVSEENRTRNVSKRSSLKTAVKKFEGAADKAAVLPTTMQALDKAASQGIIHKNAAARKKSRMAKKINAAQ